jgi:hypothetical protein
VFLATLLASGSWCGSSRLRFLLACVEKSGSLSDNGTTEGGATYGGCERGVNIRAVLDPFTIPSERLCEKPEGCIESGELRWAIGGDISCTCAAFEALSK